MIFTPPRYTAIDYSRRTQQSIRSGVLKGVDEGDNKSPPRYLYFILFAR